MVTKMPTEQEIVDAIEEIERCLWRAQDERGEGRDNHLEDLDGEVISLVRGLDETRRLPLINRILQHLEKQEGMDPELITEVFNHSGICQADLDAYRLSLAVPQAPSPSSLPRL